MAGRSRITSLIIPVIAAAAFGGAVWSIVRHQPDRPLLAPAISPPTQPDLGGASAAVAGMIGATGLVESASEDIGIAAQVGGVVTSVAVEPGARVKAGDVLFTIDDRAARADLAVRAAALEAARSRLVEAQATAADLRDQLDRGDRMSRSAPGLAISDDALTRRRFAVRVAEAKVLSAVADVANTEAQVKAGEVAVALLTVRAPIDGTILQTNVRAGEYAPAQSVATPLVIMGRIDPLHVRVSLDEADVPRFDPHAAAWGSPRGAADRRVRLSLVRVDPIVVPKTSLTGAGTERVDTRVLRVVYAFDPALLPGAFPGQQMDVFIATGPGPAAPAEPASRVISSTGQPGSPAPGP